MATGTIKWFADGITATGSKAFNLGTDTLNMGIVTTTTVPAVSTAVPHWGGTGTTNFASNQVATTGGYTGPITLASQSWSTVSAVSTLRATDIVIPQNASGFTNGAYGIFYDNTDTNKRAFAYIELSSAGTLSIVSGSVTIDFQGAGTDILTITQS